MANTIGLSIRCRKASIVPTRSRHDPTPRARYSNSDSSSASEEAEEQDASQENSAQTSKDINEKFLVVAPRPWKTAIKRASHTSTKNPSTKKKKKKDSIINFNIGGKTFKTRQRTIRHFPYSRLANIAVWAGKRFDPIRNEYFFDRNPAMFNWVLDFCRRRGNVHIPKYFCPRFVRAELAFWDLPIHYLPRCCKKHLNDTLDEILINEELEQTFKECPKNMYGVRHYSRENKDKLSWSGKVWVFLDESDSSRAAKVWAFVFLLMILVSILGLFLSTLPKCRVPVYGGLFVGVQGNADLNGTLSNTSVPFPFSTEQYEKIVSLSNKKIKILLTTEPHPVLSGIEFICLVFFTVEIMVRFIVCPFSKLSLLLNVWTILDLFYLLPVWLRLIIDVIDNSFWYDPDRVSGLLALKAVFAVRVFRMFRLMRYYRGLRMLFYAIQTSLNELMLLFVFVMFAITIFASIIYCAEIYNENDYDNIFVGLWWALVTMTTVGYGDVVPDTWPGCILACFCAFTGIILIGMPVPIIASNFHLYYGVTTPEEKAKQDEMKKKKPLFMIRKPRMTTKIKPRSS